MTFVWPGEFLCLTSLKHTDINLTGPETFSSLYDVHDTFAFNQQLSFMRVAGIYYDVTTTIKG